MVRGGQIGRAGGPVTHGMGCGLRMSLGVIGDIWDGSKRAAAVSTFSMARPTGLTRNSLRAVSALRARGLIPRCARHPYGAPFASKPALPVCRRSVQIADAICRTTSASLGGTHQVTEKGAPLGPLFLLLARPTGWPVAARHGCRTATPCSDRTSALRAVRFEPRTQAKQKGPIKGPFLFGAPDRIRTCDPCLRRAVLYPAELRAH